MSLDYPNRADWLKVRSAQHDPIPERVIRAMRAGGPTKDPGRFHAQRRRKGPLLVAAGPGSINAESELRALVRISPAAAAAFYEACQRIHYKHGKPKMHWGDRWYSEYKAMRAVA